VEQVLWRLTRLIENNPQIVVYGSICFFVGLKLGARSVDPMTVLNNSPHLWFWVNKASFDQIRNGTGLLYQNTPLGDVMLISTKQLKEVGGTITATLASAPVKAIL